MIALDTNILVHAHRADAVHHDVASRLVKDLAEGDAPWALPWPCIYEFLRVVTHARIFRPPTPIADALKELEALFDSPSLSLLGEGPSHSALMTRMMFEGAARGNLAHDAHVAALALEHGVRELLTADRGFARFPDLNTRNPFLPPAVHEKPSRYRTSRRRRAQR